MAYNLSMFLDKQVFEDMEKLRSDVKNEYQGRYNLSRLQILNFAINMSLYEDFIQDTNDVVKRNQKNSVKVSIGNVNSIDSRLFKYMEIHGLRGHKYSRIAIIEYSFKRAIEILRNVFESIKKSLVGSVQNKKYSVYLSLSKLEKLQESKNIDFETRKMIGQNSVTVEPVPGDFFVIDNYENFFKTFVKYSIRKSKFEEGL